MKKITDLQQAIGNTPCVEITFDYKGVEKKIYAKLEYYNLSGSVKDRMAYYVLKEAYARGELKETDTIVEATSGNTGIAFCALGAYMNHPVIIYMPEWMSEERKKLISSYGAEIREVTKEQGGFAGSVKLAEEEAKKGNAFLPRQFENPDNTLGQYESLGKELVRNLEQFGVVADGFVAGVGTGGTIMGVEKALRQVKPETKVYPLEPYECPTMSQDGKSGEHRVAGIGDGFVPALCKLDQLDEVICVYDGDAVIMAQKLANFGLGVGISSGANFLGALIALEKLGADSIVATVFADDSKKYLSTDLMKEEPVREEYLSKDITLKSLRMVR